MQSDTRILFSPISIDPVKQHISRYLTWKLEKLCQSNINEGVPVTIAHELTTESAYTMLKNEI